MKITLIFYDHESKIAFNELLESINNPWEPLAHLAELVDALVLGTSDFGRGSSSLPVGIFYLSCTGLI